MSIIDTHCGQNAELLNVEAGGTYLSLKLGCKVSNDTLLMEI
jgi:hypothetical protein